MRDLLLMFEYQKKCQHVFYLYVVINGLNRRNIPSRLKTAFRGSGKNRYLYFIAYLDTFLSTCVLAVSQMPYGRNIITYI